MEFIQWLRSDTGLKYDDAQRYIEDLIKININSPQELLILFENNLIDLSNLIHNELDLEEITDKCCNGADQMITTMLNDNQTETSESVNELQEEPVTQTHQSISTEPLHQSNAELKKKKSTYLFKGCSVVITLISLLCGASVLFNQRLLRMKPFQSSEPIQKLSLSPDQIKHLFKSIRSQDLNKVKELTSGYNIDGIKDNDSEFLLHWATNKGNREICEHLIINGASLDSKNIHGASPLHIASLQGYSDIIQLLYDHGANIESIDEDGQTPIDVARSEDIKQLLLNLKKSNNQKFSILNSIFKFLNKLISWHQDG